MFRLVSHFLIIFRGSIKNCNNQSSLMKLIELLGSSPSGKKRLSKFFLFFKNLFATEIKKWIKLWFLLTILKLFQSSNPIYFLHKLEQIPVFSGKLILFELLYFISFKFDYSFSIFFIYEGIN